jgi:DNA repair ATPase RecN
LTSVDDEKLINLTGEPGVGKHVVAIQAIKYCSDRNFLRDGAYQIIVESSHNCDGFLNNLFQTMRLNIYHVEDLIECIKNLHIVLMISKTREIINNDRANFEKMLSHLLENTNYLKIIVIIDYGQNNLKLRSDKYVTSIHIEPLNNYYAAKLLK